MKIIEKIKRRTGLKSPFHLLLSILFCGVLFNEASFAQTCVSEINLCEGEDITVVKTGGTIGTADHNTIYYLVNENTTTVVAVQDTDGPATFSGIAAGCYQIHVLNYSETDAPTAAADLTTVTDISTITDGCYNSNLLTDFSCVCIIPTIEKCEGDSFIVNSGGSAANYEQLYVLIDATGTIVNTILDPDIAIATDVDFAPVAVGDYLVYAINYDAADAPSFLPLAAGGTLPDQATVDAATGCFNTDFLSGFMCCTVNPLPMPNVTTGATYCDGEAIADVTATGTGGIFTWYSDANLTMVASGSTGAFNQTWVPSGTIGTETVYVTETLNGCVSSAISVTIVVNATPMAPVASGGTFCDGAVISPITATGDVGVTFNWYDDASLITSSANVSGADNETWTPAGTIGTETVYVTQTLLGCESEATLVSVTINPSVPALVASGEGSYCEGEPVSMVTVTEMTGATVAWYTDAAASIPATGVTGNSWTPPTTVGVYTLYVTQTLLNCTSPVTMVSVEVKGIPTISAIGMNPTTCNGSDGTINFTFTNVPDGMHTVNYTGGSFSVSVSGGLASIGTLSAGAYNNLAITVNGCTSSEVVDVVLMDPSVGPVIAIGDSYCANAPILPVVASGVSNAVFNWYLDSALSIPATGVSGAFNETWNPQQVIGVQTVYVTQTAFDCVSEATEVVVDLFICDGDEFEATNNFMATDPCACNNDQNNNVSGDGEGTFSEVVTVMGPSGIFVRIQSANQTGMLNLPFPADLTETATGSGVYEITFDHADGVGYNIAEFEFSLDGVSNWAPVQDINGVTIGIGNKCIYPQVVKSMDEFDFCVDDLAITLSDATLGLSEVNNYPGVYSFDFGAGSTTTFDPSVGAGPYPLAITFTGVDDGAGGVSPDNGSTAVFPGCLTHTTMLLNVDDCPADNYTMDRVDTGNALYVLDADASSVLPAIANSVYTWYQLDALGGWIPVATVNGVPYYSPKSPGTYSVSMNVGTCSCLAVGEISMTIEEIVNCDNCGN